MRLEILASACSFKFTFLHMIERFLLKRNLLSIVIPRNLTDSLFLIVSLPTMAETDLFSWFVISK